MRKSLLFLTFVIITSCSRHQDSRELAELRTKLPRIKMPARFPDDLRELINIDVADNSIILGLRKKFSDRHFPFLLAGKVFESDVYLAILGEVATPRGTPILIVFNERGEQIDSLAIYHDMSGTIFDSLGIEETFNFGYVFPDHRIISVDSTVSSDAIMDHGMPIEKPGTKKTSIRRTKYGLTDTGQIKEMR